MNPVVHGLTEKPRSRRRRLAIIDGLNVGSRNLPPRYNAAPSQELLVIRQSAYKRAFEAQLAVYTGKPPTG